MCEICSKLTTIKTPERRQWRCSGVFIVMFWTYFTPFSSVPIVDFEQVIVSWLPNMNDGGFLGKLLTILVGIEVIKLNNFSVAYSFCLK